jgi:hypothetical protein
MTVSHTSDRKKTSAAEGRPSTMECVVSESTVTWQGQNLLGNAAILRENGFNAFSPFLAADVDGTLSTLERPLEPVRGFEGVVARLRRGDVVDTRHQASLPKIHPE